MESLQPQVTVLVHSLGWALLHSLWQGLLLYGLLLFTLRFMPASSSKIRYNLSLAVLGLSFLWFADTFTRYWVHLKTVTITVSHQAAEVVTHKMVPAATGSNDWPAWFDGLVPQLEVLFPLIVALYVCGVLFFTSRFAVNFFMLRRLRTRGVSYPSREVMNMLYMCKSKLDVRRKVKLLFSEYLNVPVMTGAVKPVILVPLSMFSQLSPEQLEAILLHELAHIRRNDYLVNIIQTSIETIMFFNPFVWRISAIVREEREHCCDDMVIAATAPLSYASALAAVETFRQNPLTLAVSGDRNQLLNRIKRLMEMKKQNPGYGIIPVLILLAGLSFSLVWLSPAFAQSKKDEKKKESVKKDPAKGETVVTDDNGNRKFYPSADDMPPAEREKLQSALDKEMAEADKAMIETDKAMAEADKAMIAADKAMAEADRAMAEADKVFREIELGEIMNTAMKEVDWDKIDQEMKEAMAKSKEAVNNIDWEEINRELAEAKAKSKEAIARSKNAIAAVNWDSIGNSVAVAMQASKEAIAAIDWDSIHHAVAVARNNVAKARANPGSNNVAVTQGSGAGKGKNKSKNQSSFSYSYSSDDDNGTINVSAGEHERMLVRMEKEGLINRKESYKVEKKNGKLYINNKLQPDDTYRKYKKYMDSDKLTIKGDRNSISISAKD